MSCVTVADSRAYLSRCRLASRSSSEKPSSICGKLSTASHRFIFRAYLCERILFVVLISQLYGSRSGCEWVNNGNTYPRLV